jgi:hypothetical protein
VLRIRTYYGFPYFFRDTTAAALNAFEAIYIAPDAARIFAFERCRRGQHARLDLQDLREVS